MEYSEFQVYVRNNYEKGLEKATHMVAIFNRVIPIFHELNRSWGFRLFEQYDAILTLYGPGGHCNPTSGMISLKTDPIGIKIIRGATINEERPD